MARAKVCFVCGCARAQALHAKNVCDVHIFYTHTHTHTHIHTHTNTHTHRYVIQT